MQKTYDFEKIFKLLNQREQCVNEAARPCRTLDDDLSRYKHAA